MLKRTLYLFFVLTIALSLALAWSGVEADRNRAQDELRIAETLEPEPPLEASQMLAADEACSVTRYCAHPPPAFVSCTSPSGDCTLGSTWVLCDGDFESCSPPPVENCYPTSPCKENFRCDCNSECGHGTCVNGRCSCRE